MNNLCLSDPIRISYQNYQEMSDAPAVCHSTPPKVKCLSRSDSYDNSYFYACVVIIMGQGFVNLLLAFNGFSIGDWTRT